MNGILHIILYVHCIYDMYIYIYMTHINTQIPIYGDITCYMCSYHISLHVENPILRPLATLMRSGLGDGRGTCTEMVHLELCMIYDT